MVFTVAQKVLGHSPSSDLTHCHSPPYSISFSHPGLPAILQHTKHTSASRHLHLELLLPAVIFSYLDSHLACFTTFSLQTILCKLENSLSYPLHFLSDPATSRAKSSPSKTVLSTAGTCHYNHWRLIPI